MSLLCQAANRQNRRVFAQSDNLTPAKSLHCLLLRLPRSKLGHVKVQTMSCSKDSGERVEAWSKKSPTPNHVLSFSSFSLGQLSTNCSPRARGLGGDVSPIIAYPQNCSTWHSQACVQTLPTGSVDLQSS